MEPSMPLEVPRRVAVGGVCLRVADREARWLSGLWDLPVESRIETEQPPKYVPEDRSAIAGAEIGRTMIAFYSAEEHPHPDGGVLRRSIFSVSEDLVGRWLSMYPHGDGYATLGAAEVERFASWSAHRCSQMRELALADATIG